MSEPWSLMQRSNNGRGRPLFGVNAVVCSKKEKNDKKLEERTKKGLDRADSLLALLLAASGSHPQDQSKAGQDVQPATLVHRVNPDYPDSWKKQGLRGIVHLHITIAKDGNVRDAKVVDGDSRLAKSAEKAVKQWQYEPASC